MRARSSAWTERLASNGGREVESSPQPPVSPSRRDQMDEGSNPSVSVR